MEHAVRVAVYARLESRDPKRGARELRAATALATARGGAPNEIEEYLDYDDGPSDELERLLADARAGRLDLVVFTSLRSFAPRGVQQAVTRLEHLDRLGVRFVSVEEPQLDTTGDGGERVRGILAALSDHQRRYRSRQVRTGMARARRDGRNTGRPPVSIETRRAILRLRGEGKSVRAIARDLGISRSTVAKYQDRPLHHLLDGLFG